MSKSVIAEVPPRARSRCDADQQPRGRRQGVGGREATHPHRSMCVAEPRSGRVKRPVDEWSSVLDERRRRDRAAKYAYSCGTISGRLATTASGIAPMERECGPCPLVEEPGGEEIENLDSTVS